MHHTSLSTHRQPIQRQLHSCLRAIAGLDRDTSFFSLCIRPWPLLSFHINVGEINHAVAGVIPTMVTTTDRRRSRNGTKESNEWSGCMSECTIDNLSLRSRVYSQIRGRTSTLMTHTAHSTQHQSCWGRNNGRCSSTVVSVQGDSRNRTHAGSVYLYYDGD